MAGPSWSPPRQRDEQPPSAGSAGPRRRLLPPLWRVAPLRLVRDPPTLALMAGVLTLVAVAASAAPLYTEAAADTALRLVLSAVPDGASAKAAPVVRLAGGVDPRSGEMSVVLARLEAAPGLGPPRVNAQSISTELHRRIYYDPVSPVVTGDRRRADAPVRLFGVTDPALQLVVVSRAPGGGPGVWLPAPVAAQTGTRAGDELGIRMAGLADAPSRTTRVVGTYAVEADGRTPRDPPGQHLWEDVSSEGFPTDARRTTLRAHLAVADLATTSSLARRIGDELLWSAQADLEPSEPRWADVHRTAEAVTELRRAVVARSPGADGPAVLRPSIASGIEDLVRRADDVASAAQRGATVTSRVGIGLALCLVLAAAASGASRRRREVRLTASTGRPPASAGLLYAVELLPVALVAGVAGWWAARGLVSVVLPSSAPSAQALASSAMWCTASVGAALVVAGGVTAAATMVQSRRLEGHEDVRVPWLVVLLVAAGSATVALLTRPPAAGDGFGPLDLLVAPLVVAAVAGTGSRVVFSALRRTRGASRPPSPRTVTRWLARRRVQAPDAIRGASTAIAATGVAMLAFSMASMASLDATVADRSAVEVGSDAVFRVPSSWALDPGAPQQAPEPDDGEPLDPRDIPVARTPTLPTGQSLVWVTQTSVLGIDTAVRVLAIDPSSFEDAAAWGSPDGPVAEGRRLLGPLATQGAESAAATRQRGLAADVPALLVGTLGDLALEAGSTISVDTLNAPVPLVIRHTLTAFPGAGFGSPTLVVPADGFFTTQLNADPRLRPRPGTPRNRPVEFGTFLWSASAAAAGRTLATHAVEPDLIDTMARARAAPVFVGAEQARRYQLALGLVLAGLGLAAVGLFATRLARTSPATDVMLAWSGAGRGAPARARVIEVAVVLALSVALGAAGLFALRPLAGILLEPGDGRSPPSTLAVPGSALAAIGAWLVLTALTALAGMRTATSSLSTVEVLRGED